MINQPFRMNLLGKCMSDHTDYHQHDLNRFVIAQAAVYSVALNELKAGQKKSHWMWFVFPQIAGLGRSEIAQRYAINNVQEARRYLAHPILGSRLIESTQAVNACQGRSALQIFGDMDELKFRSAMTLFGYVAEENSVFTQALTKYFSGQQDQNTLKKLNTF